MPGAVHGEEQLVASARAGDAGAFAVLVRRYTSRLYRVALRIVGDPMDAEDVVQDAWIAVWRNLIGFRGECTLSTWLCRVVANVALRKVQRRRHVVSLEALVEQIDRAGYRLSSVPATLISDEAGNPETVAVLHEKLALVLWAIGTLPPSQRVPLVLRELEGMSYEEVAAALGVSATLLHSRLYRARVTLLATLKEAR